MRSRNWFITWWIINEFEKFFLHAERVDYIILSLALSGLLWIPGIWSVVHQTYRMKIHGDGESTNLPVLGQRFIKYHNNVDKPMVGANNASSDCRFEQLAQSILLRSHDHNWPIRKPRVRIGGSFSKRSMAMSLKFNDKLDEGTDKIPLFISMKRLTYET